MLLGTVVVNLKPDLALPILINLFHGIEQPQILQNSGTGHLLDNEATHFDSRTLFNSLITTVLFEIGLVVPSHPDSLLCLPTSNDGKQEHHRQNGYDSCC